MKNDIEFIPYGEISSMLTKDRWQKRGRHIHISSFREDTRLASRRVFISYSHDLDESFVKMFRKTASEDTRLLIFNEGISTDPLISKIMDLQIRTPERYYVVECKLLSEKANGFIQAWRRFVATSELDDEHDRIFDARIEKDILRVVSPGFVRLELPIPKIPQFRDAKPDEILNFEIDEDGAFIYWPDLDVHLGWRQLQQLIDPDAALKTEQKSHEFNKCYGRAVQKLRENAGLKRSDIAGISEKQLGRIERGECRLTTNAIESLCRAHNIDRNEYMKNLAGLLE